MQQPLFYVNPASMDDELRHVLEWVQGPRGQAVVVKVGYYEVPPGAAPRVALLEKATVCLAEAGAPHEGAVYEVALRDFALKE